MNYYKKLVIGWWVGATIAFTIALAMFLGALWAIKFFALKIIG